VSGVAIIDGTTIPVFGHFDPESYKIALGADLPGGPTLMRGRVANDYTVIVLEPPFGRLTRTIE
jgi:hypothetical protein